MIHPIDEVKKRVAIAKEDPYRDAWVGYTFLALAVAALFKKPEQKLVGGLGDNLSPDDVDPSELERGLQVEQEHTTDRDIAQEISLDHLSEDKKYYTHLDEIEKKYAPKKLNPTPMQYLFSYGSNNPKQLEERLGRKVKTIGAYIEGMARIFVGHSKRWEGAVASIEKQPGKTVYGLAAKVTANDLATMDGFEGVASGKYKRIKVKANLQDGTEIVAVAYVSTSSERGTPSKEYLRAVAKTISAHWRGDDGEPIKISDIKINNPIPPASVAAEAREGLELRSSVPQSRRGGTSVGLARAKQLSSRQNISEKTMKRMKSFFARHEVDKKAQGFRRGEVGYPSKGLQAWKLWGGDSGKKWVKKFV
jgi:hypothetical protein